MPTLLRTFPEVSRVGHQETAWSAPIPANIRFLELLGVASDAVLSDPANSVDFVISVSPDGTDVTAQVVMREPWQGGLVIDKTTQQSIPKRIAIRVGPLGAYVGWRIKVAVDIPVALVIGATVTSLP